MANKSKQAGKSSKRTRRPAQSQRLPGSEAKMRPQPEVIRVTYRGSGKLQGKVALISGGDSGIGRAAAVAFAREGADVAFIYLSETPDAKRTGELIEAEGRRYLAIRGDIAKRKFCFDAVRKTVKEFRRLDILVNNAAEQHPEENFEDITEEHLVSTFKTNIFAMFHLTQAALRYLKKGPGVVINTTSVTAYRGSPTLVDYAATKGAIVSFTRSLSQTLAQYNVRVNGVAPGPIWTPLIPATFEPKKVSKFGSDVPLGRAGQPSEVAPAYVYLASEDSTYVTGQILHVNGGEIING